MITVAALTVDDVPCGQLKATVRKTGSLRLID